MSVNNMIEPVSVLRVLCTNGGPFSLVELPSHHAHRDTLDALSACNRCAAAEEAVKEGTGSGSSSHEAFT